MHVNNFTILGAASSFFSLVALATTTAGLTPAWSITALMAGGLALGAFGAVRSENYNWSTKTGLGHLALTSLFSAATALLILSGGVVSPDLLMQASSWTALGVAGLSTAGFLMAPGR